MSLHVKYLLIGGGIASNAAAEGIRELDRSGSIVLIGQEIVRPYHRPPLSKQYLLGDKRRPYLFAKNAEWYVENDVQLRTGRRAVALDTARMSVTLDDGQEISFDRLLIATGGSARPLDVPGAELPNVFTLRTVEDADRLQHAVDKAKAEGRKHVHAPAGTGRGTACVIGGGVLGVEVAATLRQAGLEVTLLVAHDYPWHKLAGETVGKFITRYLESRGVNVQVQHRAVRLEGDGRAQRVIAGDRTFHTDLVVAAVGMRVNRDLLRGTPIAAERAILVDDHGRTSVPGIFAAGDCCAMFDPLFGKHRVFDHWEHAQVTGRLAGRNMAGADERYSGVTHLFSDVFDLSLSAWGEPRLVERHLVRGTPNLDAPQFAEIGTDASGRVSHVIAVRNSGDEPDYAPIVRSRLDVTGREEQIKDPAVNLSSL